MATLIQIQDDLIERINQSAIRWSVASHFRYDHCDCGHYGRTRRGAVRRAEAALLRLGFTEDQAGKAIRDAIDVAELHLRSAE